MLQRDCVLDYGTFIYMNMSTVTDCMQIHTVLSELKSKNGFASIHSSIYTSIHPILKDMRTWIAGAAVASTIASAVASSPVSSSSCKVRNSR